MVEWYELGDKAKPGADKGVLNPPIQSNPVTKNEEKNPIIPRMGPSGAPSMPTTMDSTPEVATDTIRLIEDYLKLIFEIQSEQADQRHQMEMLDQKVSLSLDICSTPQQRLWAQESTNRPVLIPEWPTPLQQRTGDNLSGNMDSSQPNRSMLISFFDYRFHLCFFVNIRLYVWVYREKLSIFWPHEAVAYFNWYWAWAGFLGWQPKLRDNLTVLFFFGS